MIVARDQIVALIERLRSDSELDARGIALGRLLVEDPVGPLVRACSGRTLARVVSETADSL